MESKSRKIAGLGHVLSPGAAHLQHTPVEAAPVPRRQKRPSSAKYIRERRRKEQQEEREFADSIALEIKAYERKCSESMKEANRWCEMLQVPRKYELSRRGANLCVLVQDHLRSEVKQRIVSAEMFLREHRKLEALMEVRRSESSKSQGPGLEASPARGTRAPATTTLQSRTSAVSSPFAAKTAPAASASRKSMAPGDANDDQEIALRLRAPLAGIADPHTTKVTRKLTRPETQEELRKVIAETKQLTKELEKQLFELESRGWNADIEII